MAEPVSYTHLDVYKRQRRNRPPPRKAGAMWTRIGLSGGWKLSLIHISTTEEVPYEYYILNVKLTSKPISPVASELLTPEQLEMYQVYRQTLGNNCLLYTSRCV